MKKRYNAFISPAGTPHKVPVPTKKVSKCKHEWYGSYSFDMMRVPTCMACGKPAEGKRAEESLALYKQIIDEANAKAQKRYDECGYGSFYEKRTDGSYMLVSKSKPRKQASILQIIREEFGF